MKLFDESCIRTNKVGSISNRYNVQPSFDDYDYKAKYWHSVNRDLQNINRLIKEGHKIEWSFNERFCTINNKSFNIPKNIFIRRMGEEYCNAVSL
jgi:hypothetical protein